MTTRLSTTKPTIIPIATAPPVSNPPSLDVAFAVTLLSVVDFAVGFCVGKEGTGEEVLLDELLGGAGGDVGEGEEDEGTEGGGDDNVVAGGGGD